MLSRYSSRIRSRSRRIQRFIKIFMCHFVLLKCNLHIKIKHTFITLTVGTVCSSMPDERCQEWDIKRRGNENHQKMMSTPRTKWSNNTGYSFMHYAQRCCHSFFTYSFFLFGRWIFFPLRSSKSPNSSFRCETRFYLRIAVI